MSNAASSAPAGVPESGIAQGSMFVIKGTNLGPAVFAIATTFPLRTEIGGTSVSINAGGRTIPAIMYYAGSTQAAAILPSSTPVGSATLTVSRGGATSGNFPITVVRSGIGVFTLNQTGAGDAVATLGDGFVGPLNAANPGDIVAFWATGLGPVSFDETNPAQQFDMSDVPVEAWIGGKPAEVLFRGRSACCSSVDTIYVRIPAGVGGCVTPVALRTADYVNATTWIPTAASGRTCNPGIPAVTTAEVQTILSKPTVTAGGIGLYRTSTAVGAQLGTLPDGGTGGFARYTLFPGALGFSSWDIPQIGSCIVNRGGNPPPAVLTAQWLDAGAAIGVTGAAGLRGLAKVLTPPVIGYAGIFDFGGNYIRPGTFTVGSIGGSDITAFSSSIEYTGPTLRWTNQESMNVVNRAQGLTVNWTGGDPNGFVAIIGFSTAAVGKEATAAFACSARTADGTFTVPPYITLTMPPADPTVAGAIWPASLWVVGHSRPVRMQAPGLDLAFVSLWSNDAKTVVWGSAQ